MSSLQVLLCGPPEIRWKDQPASISRRTPRALLFYLASQGGMVGRDQLLPFFWEELGESAARRRLSDTISRLRAELPDSDMLLADTSLVGLNFEQVYVDQLEFQALLDKAGRLPWQIPINDPLPQYTHQVLKKAADLWRSPRFLVGANFPSSEALDEWLTHTTQSMEHQLGRTLDRLAMHARAVGDLDEALMLTRRALLLDELEEDNNYRLLHLLIDLGHTSEAREHFDRYQKLLREELDASPSSRMVNLYRQVRDGKPAPIRSGAAPLWKVHPSVQVPFVGRSSALLQLNRAYQAGRSTFIFGESGQGKTRLLQEFTSAISPLPRLIVTTCRPAEINLPFQPLVEVLRYQVQAEEWLSLPAVWASQLSLLLPELMEMRPDLERPIFEATPEAAPGQARGVLFEAIRQLLLILSKNHRLVICIDDAHWADEATLAAIAYLLERPPFDHQALFLIAARWEESNPELEALLSTVQSTNQANVLAMARMDESEISELASYVIGQSPTDQFIRQLYLETDGNPFIVLESLRSLVETEAKLDLSRLTALPVVKSVQNLIAARLDKLAPKTRSLLEAAAIIGTDFDPEILVDILELAPMDVAKELEELSKRYLIEPVGSTPENLRHRFIHEKIKDTLLQTVNPLRARLLHGQVARALEARSPRGDQAATLAEHYELAGEYGSAFEHWKNAGRRARLLLSSGDAAWIFNRASRLIAQAPQLSDQQIHNLYYEWTEMAFEAEDVETIRQINTDLLRLGQERDSPLLIGAALDGMSDACMAANQFEAGLGYTTQAITYLEKTDNLFHILQAYNHRGVFLYMLNRVEDSIQSFQDVLSLSIDSKDPQFIRARANAHYQVAVARMLNGLPESAQNHASRSLADSTSVQHIHGQITAYSALAFSRYFLGKFEQARQDCQKGMQLAERLNAWRMLGYLHTYQSMIEMSRGNLDETVHHAKRAIEIGTQYSHGEISATGYRLLGDIYFWLFRYPKSVELFARAVQASEDKFLVADSKYRLGVSLYLNGQTELGKKTLYEAIEFTEQSGQYVIWILAKIAELMVLSREASWQQVKELHSNIESEVTRRSMPELRIIAALLLAEKALQQREFDTALEIARDCAGQSAVLGHPWLEMRSLVTLNTALKSTAQPDAHYRQRIHALLAHLEKHATVEPFSRTLRAYSKRIKQLVE